MSAPMSAMTFGFRRLSAAFLLLALVVASQSEARALDFPALTGRVVDDAHVLSSETMAQLIERLADFEAKSSDQVVVATVRSTGDTAIEPYANQLFRHWGLGQAGENNGVLLLVAIDDRKMRIEVGYGLEGILTDLLSRLIIENSMVPEFRAGNYQAGIGRGVDDIISVLEGNAAELKARAERNAGKSNGQDTMGMIFFGLFVLFFASMFGFSILASIFGKKLAPGRYKWLGIAVSYGGGSSSGLAGSRGRAGGSGGGFSGGGGSSGGGGASGGW